MGRLTSNIPHVKLEFVLHEGLNVKALGGHGVLREGGIWGTEERGQGQIQSS